jgi:hypothetical protein
MCPREVNPPPMEIAGQNSFTCISGSTVECASTGSGNFAATFSIGWMRSESPTR